MSETVTMRWFPTSEQPGFMVCPAHLFIRVQGWKNHSGVTWERIYCGLAWIRPRGSDDELHGYRREDIEQIMRDGDMDGIDKVTHWMPARFPTVSGRREP